MQFCATLYVFSVLYRLQDLKSTLQWGHFSPFFLAVDMWKYTLLQNVMHQVTTERIGPSESEPDSSEVFCGQNGIQ